jgi:hypothetical protein
MLGVSRTSHGLMLLLFSCTVLAEPPLPSSTPPEPATAPPGAAAMPVAPAAAAAPVQVVLPAPSGGTAPPLQACAVKAFDDYAVAMSDWERDWAEGVIDAHKEFRNAVIVRSHAHNSALQRDGYRIHYLAANAPDALNVDDSVASMRLFDWTPAQEQTLRMTEADYGAASDAADHDRQVADADPKSEELEVYFEESFTDNAGAGAARKLLELLGRGNAALNHCRERYPRLPAAGSGPVALPPPGGAAEFPAPPGGKP